MSELAKIQEPETTLPADPMINMIERIAMDPNADLDKLDRMLAMKERHEASSAKAAHDQAFAKASAQFPEIPLNGRNTHNGTRYALLKDIISKTRTVLAEYGFSLSFSTEITERDVVVTAELAHEQGHTRRNSLPLPRDTGTGRNAVQAVGSTQTYGQRYTAQAILGLSLGEDADDDGETGAPAPKKMQDSWAQTVVQDMHPNATPADKAKAIADAITASFGRKTTERQLHAEWDRREHLIEGASGFEAKYPHLYDDVLAAYDARLASIKEES